MRFISLILSIYLISLTGVACADYDTSSYLNPDSTIVQANDHDHTHSQHDNDDGCSPLCYCNCCHTQLNLSATAISREPEKQRPVYFIYQENITGLEVFELLHPPKI